MTTQEMLTAFRKLSVLVIGDICLDRWCIYDPTTAEASRETGIPRVGVVSTEVTPGAGGTVANNLIALGAGRVAVIGAIGEDGFGYELRHALKARGIISEWLVESAQISTFTYTKLINAETGVEDLPRVDFINTSPLVAGIERSICENVQSAVDEFDVILIADQAETNQGGVVTAGVRDLLADLAPKYPEKVAQVDSRARIDRFRNLLLKPNEQEAEAACLRLFGRMDYPELLKHTHATMLWVTHGGRGVEIISPHGEFWVPARTIENPVDICGAGDSFAAGAGLAMAVTHSPRRAVEFGHLVASITIMKKGTGTASPEEVLAAEAAHAQ